MVPPDSRTQELTVPNHRIPGTKNCMISFEFISFSVDQMKASSAAADLQATAP